MPWELIGTLVLGIGKFIFERIAKRKLDDKEFLEHIEAHQKRRQNAGKTAIDFEDAMSEAEAKLDAEDKKSPQ